MTFDLGTASLVRWPESWIDTGILVPETRISCTCQCNVALPATLVVAHTG